MSLFRNRQFVIHTDLHPEDVHRIRSTSIVSKYDLGKKILSELRGQYNYEGTVETSTFSVSRINLRGRDFTALIRGVIRPDQKGSAIILTIERNKGAAIFIFIFLAIIAIMLVSLVGQFLHSFFQGEVDLLLLLCGIFPSISMFLFGAFGFMFIPHYFEVKFATKYFSKILQADSLSEIKYVEYS